MVLQPPAGIRFVAFVQCDFFYTLPRRSSFPSGIHRFPHVLCDRGKDVQVQTSAERADDEGESITVMQQAWQASRKTPAFIFFPSSCSALI